MKKKIIGIVMGCVFVLCICMMVGCSHNNENAQEECIVFSFSGQCEQFEVSNGVIVLSSDEEIFYGGELKVHDQEQFADISSFSAEFYTLIDGEKRPIMVHQVTDQTGGTVNISGDLGKMSGKSVVLANKTVKVSELIDNLCFELNTVSLSGQENTSQTQMTVIKVND